MCVETEFSLLSTPIFGSPNCKLLKEKDSRTNKIIQLWTIRTRFRSYLLTGLRLVCYRGDTRLGLRLNPFRPPTPSGRDTSVGGFREDERPERGGLDGWGCVEIGEQEKSFFEEVSLWWSGKSGKHPLYFYVECRGDWVPRRLSVPRGTSLGPSRGEGSLPMSDVCVLGTG